MAVAAALSTLAARSPDGLRLDPAESPVLAELVGTWRSMVSADLTRLPLPPSSDRLGPDAPRVPVDNPLMAYGSTVLVSVVRSDGVEVAQLGDGDVVAVAEDGRAWRPLAEDDRLFANETTSLCLPGAVEDFRTARIEFGDRCRLVLMATDGYANSFRDEAGFLATGGDFLGMLRKNGAAAVEAALPRWLTETSRGGAGDDVSVALIWSRP
jgi:Protein phosphatase 2C